MRRDGERKPGDDEPDDCQAQEARTCRACRKANDFNSVPLSWHAGSSFVLPSFLPFLSFRLFPRFCLPPRAPLFLFRETKSSSNRSRRRATPQNIQVLDSKRGNPPMFRPPSSSSSSSLLLCNPVTGILNSRGRGRVDPSIHAPRGDSGGRDEETKRSPRP